MRSPSRASAASALPPYYSDRGLIARALATVGGHLAIGRGGYEVRSFTGWHRHVTLAMLAHAYLAALRRAAIGGVSRPTSPRICCR